MASYGGGMHLTHEMQANNSKTLDVTTDLPFDGADGQGSPIRRSTRVCAKRAAEKISDSNGIDDNSMDVAAYYAQINGASTAINGETMAAQETEDDGKRRRLAADHALDQFSAAFGVRLLPGGDVCLLSEDSSEESMPADELEQLRKTAVALTKATPTAEQKLERRRMIEQLKATLRVEETNLLMLRKLKECQRQPVNDNRQMLQQQQQAKVQQQQKQLQQQMARQQEHKQRQKQAQEQAMMEKQLQQLSNTSKPPMAHQHPSKPPKPATPVDPATKQMQAKLALRKQLEKTLLAIKPPTPPPTNLVFVPTVNQMDFMAYVGLDQVVQKVLRDKRVTHPQVPEPWQCAQCSVDFTPAWQTVGGDEGEEELCSSSLYCEACARANEKKVARTAHTGKFKAEFVKALKNEQAISQMKDGNIDWAKLGLPRPATPPPAPQLTNQTNGAYGGGAHQQGNIQNYSRSSTNNRNSSNYSAAARQANQQQQQQHQQQQQQNQLLANQFTSAQQQMLLQQQLVSLFTQQQQQQSRQQQNQMNYSNQMAMLMGMGGSMLPGNMLNNMNNMNKDMVAQQQQRLLMDLTKTGNYK